MVTRVLQTDDLQTLSIPIEAPIDSERRPTTPVPLQSVPLLYGVSLAVALPPAAWLPPSHQAVPAISSRSCPIIATAELRTALNRPVAEAGRGYVALGDVDLRLHGLTLSLDLFRAAEGSRLLIAFGLVRSDRAISAAGGMTPTDLWRLARTEMSRHGRMGPCRLDAGADSVLVMYGSATAQIAWLVSGFLATVSVTSLDGAERQTTELAHASACLLASRLASRAYES
jgi:hypothetical protein